MGRPPTGLTPLRTVRVDDETWESASQAARERGENVSAVIRRALREYVTATPQDPSGPPPGR